ncbi:MAG: hypothetical protein RLZZ428_323 [Pseudomonadota bacterium]|jgi:UPF0716 family protein affecting phage T7 exclusion
MVFLIVPFALIELYVSLKTGEKIGFFWSVMWIIGSFMLGVALLKRSPFAMMSTMQSVGLGKIDLRGFQNASMSYFIGAIFLIIPGVFSDFLGLVSLGYALYLQIHAKMTPMGNTHFKQKGDENVIDVEIIDEYSSHGRSS